MRQKFIILAILIAIVVGVPKTPVWPNTFTQTFSEDLTLGLAHGTTTGTIYYDWPSQRYRIDRQNGKLDRYCGTVLKLQDTPCNHYVVNGKRYLDFPQKSYCCYCCDAAHGCGVLKPNWLDGAVFKGYVTQTPNVYEKWQKDGLQPNYYYCTADSQQIMKEIDQVPDDVMVYSVPSFKTTFNKNLLNLPSYCSVKETCPLLSVCTPLRGESGEQYQNVEESGEEIVGESSSQNNEVNDNKVNQQE